MIRNVSFSVYLAVVAIYLLALARADDESYLARMIRTVHYGKSDENPFSYNGATGPDEWPGLCRTGKQQSPINIVGDSILSGTQPLVFRWSELVYNVTYTNTGTTLRATLPPNDPSHVIKNGVRYYLIQFHLHNPSEHRFDGFNAALEMHFVHASPEGELLVVALLLDPKAQTRQSPRFYTEFIDLIADEDTTPRNPEESVVLGSLERANPAPIELGAVRKVFGPLENKFFAYLGSFTTPPCTEGVRWLVYRFMVHIPVRNLFAVQHVLPHTARVTQPWNGRLERQEQTFEGEMPSQRR